MVEAQSQSDISEAASTYKDPIYEKFKGVLKGAEEVLNLFKLQGNVVTRFPPEPSGYLHIGHTKAAMLNYHYAKMYKGSMILRFDDTNPMNEKIEFVENIIRDLKTLDIHPDRVTHTSDYFENTKTYMEDLIKKGLAYADDTPSEQMKKERDEGIESKYREASIEDNLKRFYLMLQGKHDEDKKEEEKKDGEKKKSQGKGKPGAKPEVKKKEEEKKDEPPVPESNWCMRAKMNMQNPVKCLRDPVFYRVKLTPHHKTGTKYKAYPTYDFACPIVDALEGVTHAMRTIEYHDRNALYAWVQDNLGLRKVEIYDYCRLCMVSTVLSKRSLKWFVENNIADGWYDPRFPTVQGIMRRGMTVQALKQFMLEQGPSKNTNLQEWDKIWALNKDVIDPIAPRYTGIDKQTACKLIIENGPEGYEAQSHPLHPKNASIGSKAVLQGKEVYIEKEDAVSIQEGEKITLMKWGNVTVSKKEEIDGRIVLTGKVDPEDKDFKKTKKLTWVIADPSVTVDVKIIEFDHLITKKKVEENEEIKDLVNPNSKVVYYLIGEGCMRNLQKGSIIQLERRGYFFVDEIAFGEKELTLNFIPDGKTKNMSKVGTKLDVKETAKGKGQGAQFANKTEAAKAAGQQQNQEGGEKKLSKKEMKKAAKKEQKKKGKEGGQGEGEAKQE